MVIDEEFEVAFKDNDCEIQKELLKNAIHDLKNNIYEYNFVTKKDKNDQTLKFIEDNGISRYDIKCLLDDFDYSEDDLRCYGDILKDRKFKNNYLYILYFDNAIVGNWDYRNSDEKLLYIKWNPLNKNIISFHTMRKIHKTNRDKLKENLTLQQIRSKDIYSKNAHVNYFYDIRKGYLGNPNTNIKFITSQLNEDGSADFLFQTVVTPYEDENHKYKRLVNAPTSNQMNSGEMENNSNKEYMMCIRINDFWDLIELLEIVEQDEFDKNTLSAIIDLSEDVKFSCDCPSYVWTGISYFATLENASLIPNNIYPKKWNKYRDGALCCKHLSGLFRQLGFFIPQMAMSIKKNMVEQGLLY